MPREFFIVDVFTDRAYSGNQLAVVTDARGLRDRDMQAIAREMNFSETTFVLPAPAAGRGPRVRIFTPRREVPFAGHPTLGTAHVIRTELWSRPRASVALELGVGTVPVFYDQRGDRGLYWMRQPAPTFGRIVDRRLAAAAVGLRPADLMPRWPVQEVSTGLGHLVIPVRSRAALERARVDRGPCFALLEQLDAKAVLLFTPAPRRRSHQLSVRVFVDWYGVPEDPATGSGNGCLAAYLARHRCLGDSRLDVRAEQGWLLGRPSVLHLRATDVDGKVDVRVGGGCVTIASGRLAA
jgi:trans-2,3-dihydro-3-hydroxyanthranilate isomerase